MKLGIRHHVRSISIRHKLILALLFVSLFSIVSVSVVSLVISRNIILDNTDQMAKNIMKQISHNLDERVKTFEDTTFSIFQQNNMKQLFDVLGNDNISRQPKELVLSDSINQSPSLYRYVKYAFVENNDRQRFHYNRYRYNESSRMPADLGYTRDFFMRKLDKQTPLRWQEFEGELFFARLIIDQRDFSIQGIAVFIMNDSFLDFLDDQDILSKRNLIIAHRESMLFQGDYNYTNPEIKEIISSSSSSQQIVSQTIRYEGKKTLTTIVNTPKKNWKVLCLIQADVLYEKDRLVIMLDVLIAMGAFLLSIFLTLVIAKSIVRNINRMEECMTQVEDGDFHARMKPANYDEVGKMGLRLNYMIMRMETLIDTIATERASKQQVEFQALQAQVNPHFLYNTLGSIKWLANKRKEKELENMLDSLIDLLKGSIRKSSSFQTVTDEIQYIKSYMTLQSMRYGDAFTIRYEIDPQISNAVVPGFLLQPIIENAIFHGIDIAAGDGIITVRGGRKKKMLFLQVEDNGIGLSAERIQEIISQPKQYKGFNSIGVNLVYERIRAYYGKECSFSISSQLHKGTLVEITLPYATEIPKERGGIK